MALSALAEAHYEALVALRLALYSLKKRGATKHDILVVVATFLDVKEAEPT